MTTATLLRVPRQLAVWLQTSLNRVLGSGLTVDGLVGPRTQAAIATFQRRVGLHPTGSPDEQLIQALTTALRRRGGGSTPAPAPTPSRSRSSLPNACAQRSPAATTPAAYVALLRRAESELAKVGRTSLEDKLHALSGLYYGTVWSRDYSVEQSPVRNAAFQLYVARRYGPGDDPRRWPVDCSPFSALWRSQDVARVDLGHAMIGLNARMRFASRSVPIPPAFATGLEITTWVGDISGAAARLALGRLQQPGMTADRWFRGTDYGSSSNLEGDIAAYVMDAAGATSVRAPTTASVAEIFERYLVRHEGWRDRFAQFLRMNGGRLAGTRLTNRAEVHSSMSAKVGRFGSMYLVNYERSRPGGAQRIAAALPAIGRAAGDVVDEFLDRLVRGVDRGRLG